MTNFESIHADFLLTDVEVGLTFLDIAKTSQDAETIRRNEENAWRAYDAVTAFLPRLTLSPEDREALQTKLQILKCRLDALEATRS